DKSEEANIMDFALDEDLEMFRKNIRKYLDKEGQTDVARAFIKGNTELVDQTIVGLAELGTTAVNISEENEGIGLGTVALVPIFEKYGTKEQKEKYLPEIASGSRTVTLAWLEPGSDYGPLDVQCEGKQTGDKLIINGTKEMVPEADTVDTLLTVVRTSQSDRKEGISLVLIDKDDVTSIEQQLSFDETKHLGKVSFNDVKVSKEDVLGGVNQGWEVLEEGL